jgi:dihydroxyacetone kinase-like predicted kinase
MQKYCLKFILHIQNASPQAIKNSLSEFGEVLEITALCQDKAGSKGEDLEININTEDPTAIFDICSQFGRIRTVKVDEIK